MNQKNEYMIATPPTVSIADRWKKTYGYVPASENPVYQEKWKAFRALSQRTLDDIKVCKKL
jgi:hypothetical protein